MPWIRLSDQWEYIRPSRKSRIDSTNLKATTPMATASRKDSAMSKAPARHPESKADAPAPVPAAAPSPFKFAIESGIPLPDKRIVTKGETAYPFAVLEVGQSFFVPCSDKMKEPWKTLTSMTSRVSRDMHPKRFTTARGKGKNAEGVEVDGVRVWRVQDTTKPLAPPKKINRKPRKDSEEGKRLAAEAIAGDTSQREHPAPDFDIPSQSPPPPPPPPAA